MNEHLYLPLIVPLLGAMLTRIGSRSRRLTHWSSLLVAEFNLGYGIWLYGQVEARGHQITQVGNWVAPYGISLVADYLTAIMIALAALLVLAALLFSFATLDRQREHFFFYSHLLLLLLGANGVFLAGDIFNLYVWFEVLLVAGFVLLVLGGGRHQLESGLKYIVLNLLGSTGLLAGCGLLYGMAGTLNMAQLSERVGSDFIERPGMVTVLASIFLVAYGTRAAIFPLFFWLPDSYHTPPVIVSTMLGGLLSRVGIYALYRVFSLLYQKDLDSLLPLLLLLSGLTMVTGVLGAISQTHIRRILSFLLISQTGYMLMGLALAGLAGERGLAAGVLFLVHDALVVTALFCIGGTAEYIFNQGNIERMGGLARREPVLTVLWFCAFISLAGIPPLGGFFARLMLLQVSLSAEAYLLAAVASLVNLLFLVPLLRIWNEVFWKPLPDGIAQPRRVTVEQVFPGALLVGALLMFALTITSMVDYSYQSAQQVFNTTEYIDAVLRFTDPGP